MSINEATVKYIGNNNQMFQVPIVMLRKDINPRNFNKIKATHFIAPAFAYMMSLHVYYSDRKGRQIYNTTDEDAATVIISDEQLAEVLGCSERQADRVMMALQQLFNLKYERLHETHGARKVTITNRVIEFLKIYTYQGLNSYIVKYDIHSEHMRAIKQLFEYRAWGVKPKWLSPEQRQARNRYVNKRKDFYHQVYTNHISDEQRIKTVKSNRDKISGYKNQQLDRIIEEKKKGRLTSYWFKLLIRLEQFVTYAIEKLKSAAKRNTDNQESNMPIDSESNQGESVAHEAATQKSQRIPEDLDPNYIAEVFVNWNNMTRGTNIPNIKALSQNDINAINTMVNSFGKETVLENIWKVTGLNSVSEGRYKMTFSRFMTERTMEIINSSGIMADIEAPWLTDRFIEETGLVVHDRIEPSSLQTFNSIQEVISWWNTSSSN